MRFTWELGSLLINLGQELNVSMQNSDCLQYLAAYIAPPVGLRWAKNQGGCGAVAVRDTFYYGLVRPAHTEISEQSHSKVSRAAQRVLVNCYRDLCAIDLSLKSSIFFLAFQFVY